MTLAVTVFDKSNNFDTHYGFESQHVVLLSKHANQKAIFTLV